jgi:cytochrome c oxidase assembly protein subunit 15
VRVSGAGMGCPDWPKCFDRWIPPTSLEQLPDHIDPALFNIVLAWIEYCNRLFGALVGLCITITLFLALKYYYKDPKIKWSVFIAFILTLVQGWLGSVLVHTVLNPITITLHLLFALIIVLLLIYASQASFYLQFPNSEKQSHYSPGLKTHFSILLLTLLLEVILGTEIRGGLEMIRKENPIVDSQFLLTMLGPFKYLHTLFGILIALISSYLLFILVKKGKNPSVLIKVTSALIVFLVYGQVFIGEMLVFLDVIPLLQLFHLWFASLILGLVMIQFTAWKQSIKVHE